MQGIIPCHNGFACRNEALCDELKTENDALQTKIDELQHDKESLEDALVVMKNTVDRRSDMAQTIDEQVNKIAELEAEKAKLITECGVYQEHEKIYVDSVNSLEAETVRLRELIRRLAPEYVMYTLFTGEVMMRISREAYDEARALLEGK